MRRPVVFILILFAGLLAWLYWRHDRPPQPLVSGFIEADEIRVGSRVGGRVSQVLVDEGGKVKVGQPLLKIDPFDLMERFAEAQARLASNRAELARLKTGYRPEEIAQARARRDQAAATRDKLAAGPREREIEIAREKLKIANAGLDLAQSEFDRVARLREENRAASMEYDQALRTLKSARSEVTSAQQELALLEEGTRKEDVAGAAAALTEAQEALKLIEAGFRAEDIDKAAAQVAASEAQVAAIQTQIEELTVGSPCDCVVEAVELRPGDLIAANAPSLSLLDTSRLWVRTYVPESMLDRVRLDQRVRITVDAYPKQDFTGRITFLATQAEFTPRNIQTPEERSKQVFRIKVTLESGQEQLRVGMSADVHLE